MLDHPTRTDRRRAAAARRARDCERQRRHRALERNGYAVAPVKVSAEMIDLLCRLGWLRDTDAVNPQKVGAAISALLADSARH